MSPILEQYISGDKGGFYELIQAITAASADHKQGIQVCLRGENEPAQDVRTYQKRTRAKDVTQRRKGYVQFIF